MLKKSVFVIIMSAAAITAFAGHEARSQAEQVIDLKNGSTVYIFKDGKMAMEDKLGRAVRMNQGEVMETMDGQKIVMHGDEVMRLKGLLKRGHAR